MRHVQELPVTRKRVGSDKRSSTFHYFFQSNKERHEVCRTFFINTLDLKRDFVYNTLRRQSCTGGLIQNLQGKHGNQRKTDDNLLQGVRDHINSFQAIDSHYCRSKTEWKYIDPSLSVSAMYRLYSKLCDE